MRNISATVTVCRVGGSRRWLTRAFGVCGRWHFLLCRLRFLTAEVDLVEDEGVIVDEEADAAHLLGGGVHLQEGAELAARIVAAHPVGRVGAGLEAVWSFGEDRNRTHLDTDF